MFRALLKYREACIVNWRKIAAIASFVAAMCFFVAYLFAHRIMLMLLGGVWLCIGAVNLNGMSGDQ